jgi:hypothetical protein
LKARGYTTFEKEGIVVEDGRFSSCRATTDLEREAYINAQLLDFDGSGVRVVLPEHLVAIMLSVGRQKDHRSYKNVSIAGSGEVGSPRGGHQATRSFSKMG